MDPQRVALAVELYNRACEKLLAAGWEETVSETTPGWWWRHPKHAGTFAMDAALTELERTSTDSKG